MTPLLLVIPLIAAAPVPKEFKKAPPILGPWYMAGLEIDGKPSQFNKGMIWRFADGTASLEYGRDSSRTIPLKTDHAVNPPHFDFDNGSYQLGIYQVVGDRLTVCMSRTKERPNRITSAPGFLVYTFERAGEKDVPKEDK